ncbi:hypothetical protein [Ferroplasma sp.]|uniref:hypothetical protein n=1 Tax=Ferroplasma sp. TaxID=2591003 RepID=UPI00260F953B|nr:hypothetical protein [Ferroplasma sp.]
MAIEEDLRKAQNYFYKKVSQWNKDPTGFENYIRVEKVDNLTKEFNEDKGNPNHDFNDVCRFLKDYEANQQKDALASIISVINDSFNFSADVINILIAAILKACYPNSPEVDRIIKDILTGVGIGVGIAGVITLLSLLFSKR